jgi:hypothetical protein
VGPLEREERERREGREGEGGDWRREGGITQMARA